MPLKLIPPGKRPYWYVRGSVDGRRYEISTGEKDRGRAKTWKADFERALARDRVPDAGEPVGFASAAKLFADWRRPNKLEQRLINRVAGWFAEKPLAEIRHAHVVEAANALLPDRAGATKNRKVIVPVAAVLHYASEQGWVEYRRIKKFPEPRRSSRQPATDETMAALLEATTGPKQAFLAVLYETGLRLMDVLRIDWAALNLPAARLAVKVGKTDERMVIPLSPALVAVLAVLPRTGPRVFPWQTSTGIYRWLKPLCAGLGITYTPHQSRHALATAALVAGVPDRQAADLGAWRDSRSLHRYQHVQPETVAGRSVGNLVAINPNPLKRKA